LTKQAKKKQIVLYLERAHSEHVKDVIAAEGSAVAEELGAELEDGLTKGEKQASEMVSRLTEM
jgi:hypothetical protein